MRIYRENLEKSAILIDFGRRILLKTLSIYAKFPKQENRELNPANRESKFGLQGLDPAGTGNPPVAAKKGSPSEPKTCSGLVVISEDRKSIFGGESTMTTHQDIIPGGLQSPRMQILESPSRIAQRNQSQNRAGQKSRPSGSKTCIDVTLVSKDQTPILKGEIS